MNAAPSTDPLLTPQNCTVIFIDHQPQMTFGVTSIDRQLLLNNVVGLAKAAKVFNVPVILTTVEITSFSGNMWPQLLEIFPGQQPIERTSMNSWEDENFVAQVEKIGRKKLVMAALWTEVCLTFPALQARRAGYEVYAVEDASGGTSEVAHRTAMQRVFQAGVTPVSWVVEAGPQFYEETITGVGKAIREAQAKFRSRSRNALRSSARSIRPLVHDRGSNESAAGGGCTMLPPMFVVYLDCSLFLEDW